LKTGDLLLGRRTFSCLPLSNPGTKDVELPGRRDLFFSEEPPPHPLLAPPTYPPSLFSFCVERGGDPFLLRANCLSSESAAFSFSKMVVLEVIGVKGNRL